MKTKILGFLLVVVSLTGCSSIYKSGQTPDDVYYSEGSPSSYAILQNENNSDGEYITTNRGNRYNPNSFDEQYQNNSWREDQFLRMGIRNRWRMGIDLFNDYSFIDPWYTNSWQWNSFMTWNSPFNSPWNSSMYWNSFYNPYCSYSYNKYPYGAVINKGNYIAPSRSSSPYAFSNYMKSSSNSGSYNFKNTNSYKNRYGNSGYINTNNKSTLSNSGRRTPVFTIDNNTNNRSTSEPSRSYNPSGNSSSPSRSSGSGSSGSGSRPVRNGGGK